MQVDWNPSRWISCKFKAPGVRYEVGISIFSGFIVWINGPFPAGQWHDITIFRRNLKRILLSCGEYVEADDGYRGEPDCIRTPTDLFITDNKKKLKCIARRRHETCNRRFKHWNSLQNAFRHSAKDHEFVFTAIAVMTQLEIENDNPLFQVQY